MDPVACWNDLTSALYRLDFDEAADRANDLRQWQLKGGFVPDCIPEGVMGRLRDFAYVLRAVAHEGAPN